MSRVSRFERRCPSHEIVELWLARIRNKYVRGDFDTEELERQIELLLRAELPESALPDPTMVSP